MRILRLLGRALLLRCPHCGSSGVVRPWARVAEACPHCRHRFEREEGYWLGAVLLNTVAGVAVFAVLLVVMAVATWPDVPWTAVSITTLAVGVVFPVAFYPWARMLWIALDMAIRPPDGSG